MNLVTYFPTDWFPCSFEAEESEDCISAVWQGRQAEESSFIQCNWGFIQDAFFNFVWPNIKGLCTNSSSTCRLSWHSYTFLYTSVNCQQELEISYLFVNFLIYTVLNKLLGYYFCGGIPSALLCEMLNVNLYDVYILCMCPSSMHNCSNSLQGSMYLR